MPTAPLENNGGIYLTDYTDYFGHSEIGSREAGGDGPALLEQMVDDKVAIVFHRDAVLIGDKTPLRKVAWAVLNRLLLRRGAIG